MHKLVVGYGEIGRAVAEVFYISDWIDVGSKKVNYKEYNVLHVAIPYTDDFSDIVNEYINKYKIDITFVHSTIKIGTMRKIKGIAFHAPIRGRHPHLAKSIQKFTMFVSGEREDKDIALVYLDTYKIPMKYCIGHETTEAAKLLSLAQYAVNIEFARYAKKICDRYGLSYTETVKCYTKSYNEGFEDSPHFTKPILEPPIGPIGGHCILKAIKILDKSDPDEIIFSILAENIEAANKKRKEFVQTYEKSISH